MRGAELLGLVAFALALMLLIALATFDPRDPAPFFKAGVEGPARNFIGPFGAFLAEMLIPQLFGLAALLLPIVLGLLGWKLFWCKPIDAPYTKAVGNGILLTSLAGLLSLAVGTVELRGRARARRGRRRRDRLGPPGRGLQPHGGLHPGRDRPLRRAHSLDAVLLLHLPRGRRQPVRGAPPDAADRLGPLPREPAQGAAAARRHPQAHRGRAKAAACRGSGR